MNDIERSKRRAELEVEYNRAVQLAHDQSRDGLAQHLIAAMAQYKLAELAATPESRLAHQACARTHETLVEERKKVLSAASALEGVAMDSPAPAAGSTPVQSGESGKKAGKKGKDELYGFDPESCRVKDVPAVSFDDIIGSESTIAALRQAFHHNEELFKFRNLTRLAPLASRPDHHLMYGPPGTGKSFLCKAIAHEVMTSFPNTEKNPFNSAFFNVNSAEICSPYYAVPEKRLDALFNAAAKYRHCVICIDEMERLCPDRNGSGAEMTAVADAVALVTRLLQLIDGVTQRCNAIILCATNYPWKVDKAMRDRLSSKLLLDLPGEEAKRQYLLQNVGLFLGRTEAERRASVDTLLTGLDHASYRDLDTLAQGIQVTGLHKTIANHPGEYGLDTFDPLDEGELRQQLAGVVIAYDAAYHARLKDPSRWSSF